MVDTLKSVVKNVANRWRKGHFSVKVKTRPNISINWKYRINFGTQVIGQLTKGFKAGDRISRRRWWCHQLPDIFHRLWDRGKSESTANFARLRRWGDSPADPVACGAEEISVDHIQFAIGTWPESRVLNYSLNQPRSDNKCALVRQGESSGYKR